MSSSLSAQPPNTRRQGSQGGQGGQAHRQPPPARDLVLDEAQIVDDPADLPTTPMLLVPTAGIAEAERDLAAPAPDDPLARAVAGISMGGARLGAHAAHFPLPDTPSAEEAAEGRTEILHAMGEWKLPGWGAHGEAAKALEWLPLSAIASNPDHPRDDWQVQDKELEALARSLIKGELSVDKDAGGQMEPLLVTPVLPGDPLQARGYRVVCLDGHRRLAAAAYAANQLHTPIRRMLCDVRIGRDGLPLSPLHRAAAWMTTHARKRPSFAQLVRGCVAMRAAWEEEHAGELPGASPFPDQEELAARMGVSQQTISRAEQVAYEPEPVWRAVAERQLTGEAVRDLIARVPDPRARERAVRRALDATRTERSTSGRALAFRDIVPFVPEPHRFLSPATAPVDVRRRTADNAPLWTPGVLAEQPRDAKRLLGALALDLVGVYHALDGSGAVLHKEVRAALELLADPKLRGHFTALLEPGPQ